MDKAVIANLVVIVVSALATAAATQLLVIWYERNKRNRERKEIRALIERDLRELQMVMEMVIADFYTLRNAIHSNGIHPHRLNIFTQITREVFQSIPLTTLHEVYGNDIMKIIRVYQDVEYASLNQPQETFKLLSSQFNVGDANFKRWFEKYAKDMCDTSIAASKQLITNISGVLPSDTKTKKDD
jgi:hypothetical protein